MKHSNSKSTDLQHKIRVEFPDLAADNSNTAPIVQREFSGELAKAIVSLIDAGRYGVPRASIPKKLIPLLVRAGLYLQFFSDPLYGPDDTRKPMWARFQMWGGVRLVEGVA